MDDKTLTIVVSAGTAVVAAFITSVLTSSRDKSNFRRSKDRDHLEAVRSLYAEALGLIVFFSNAGASLNREQGEKFMRVFGMLKLLGTDDVVSSFAVAKEFCSQSGHVRQGDLTARDPAKLEDLAHEKRETLVKVMKAHLDQLERRI